MSAPALAKPSIGLAKAAAFYYATKGIRVNAVAPNGSVPLLAPASFNTGGIYMVDGGGSAH
jgi:NAD(P)-dependent dehydrogenase (short-subunit alcohol dehydrogenase family)